MNQVYCLFRLLARVYVLHVSQFKHYGINHSILFANQKNHGIENFWKRHMRKFNGIPTRHFELFLKECEWRFNNRGSKTQLKQLKQWVKQLKQWVDKYIC